jgi:hypothetical protein
MLKDQDKLKAMGLASRSEYENKYTGRKIYRELLEIYQGLIDAVPQ